MNAADADAKTIYESIATVLSAMTIPEDIERTDFVDAYYRLLRVPTLSGKMDPRDEYVQEALRLAEALTFPTSRWSRRSSSAVL